MCADGPELCAQMTRPPHFACMCFLLRSPLLLKPSFFFLPQILMSFWGSEILKVRLCISFGVFVFVLMVSGALVTLLIYQCLVCEDSGRAWKDTRAPPPFQALQSWALNLASKYVDCWIYAYGMMHICEHLVKQVLVPHRCLIYNLLDAIAFRHEQTWCLKMANNVNTQGFSGLDTGPVQERLTLVFLGIMFQHTKPTIKQSKKFHCVRNAIQQLSLRTFQSKSSGRRRTNRQRNGRSGMTAQSGLNGCCSRSIDRLINCTGRWYLIHHESCSK